MGPSDAALRWKNLNIQISQIKSEKLINYRLRQIKIFGNLRPDEMKHVFPVNRISATVMPSRRKTWKFVSILLHCGLEIFVWSTLLQSHSEIYHWNIWSRHSEWHSGQLSAKLRKHLPYSLPSNLKTVISICPPATSLPLTSSTSRQISLLQHRLI